MLHRSVYAFAPERRIFATSQGGQSLRLWRLDELGREVDKEGVAPLAELAAPGGGVIGLGIVAGQVLVTVHREGRLKGWGLEEALGGELVERWAVDAGFWLGAVEFFKGGEAEQSLLALGGEGGEVALIEFGAGEEPLVVRGAESHREQVEALAFSADGQGLASAGQDREIWLWERGAEGALVRRRVLKGSGGWPLALAYSPDGRKLVSGCMDNGVYLWDLEAREALRSVRFDHAGWVGDVTWTGDGQRILSASWDNSCGVFGGQELRPLYQFAYHRDYVVRVLAVPGRALFLAASYDGEVSLWDGEKGELVHVFRGHQDWVTELVWLGEGEFLSLSSDGGVRVWSLQTMGLRAVLGAVEEESFELGGSFDLASFGLEGTAKEVASPAVEEEEAVPQVQVVRRFDEKDPLVDLGPQKTAMDMLEGTFEGADSFDVADEFEDAGSEGLDTFEFSEELESGDELSELVWSAISDVEESATADELRSVFEEESVPESAPDYDPQPLEPGEALSDLILDEEDLDLAFGEAVSVLATEEPVSKGPVAEEPAGEEAGPAPTLALDPKRLKKLSRRFKRHLASEEELEQGPADSAEASAPLSSPDWQDELAEVVTQKLEAITGEESQGVEEPEEFMMRAPRLFGEPGERDDERMEEPASGLASRRLGEFQRRERTLGRGKFLAPNLDELRSEPRSLKIDEVTEKVSLGEGTIPGEDKVSGGPGEGGERLRPGQAGEPGELKMPEPEPTEADIESVVGAGETEALAGPPVVDEGFEELWALASRATPSMRILKRAKDFGVGYEPVRTLATDLLGRMRLGISRAERQILGVDSQGMLEIWQTRGSREHQLKVSDAPVLEAGFLKGSEFLWALGAGGEIQLLSTSQLERGPSSHLLRAVVRSESRFSCGFYVEDQQLLLTGSPDGRARLWSLKEGKNVATFADHEAALTAVVIGRRGPITASVDGQMRFWNRRGVLVDQLQTSSPIVGLIAKEGLVAWVQADGGIRILREGQSQPIQLPGHHGAGRALAFREDGYFISGGEDGRLLVYDGVQEEPVQEISVPAPVHDLAVSERVLAVACEGGKIFLYRRESKK